MSNPFAIQYDTVCVWCNMEIFRFVSVWVFYGYSLIFKKLFSGHLNEIPDLPFAYYAGGP